MLSACARARKSCVRHIRFCQPFDIAITLTPFDAEFLPDGAVDLKFGFPGAEQPRNKTAPLVNLLARGFGVRLALTGADDGWILGFHWQNCSAYGFQSFIGVPSLSFQPRFCIVFRHRLAN